jgi:cytochrome c oxidase subunit 1
MTDAVLSTPPQPSDRFRLEIANFGVAAIAFGLGAIMAVMQAASRADLPVLFRSPKVYYLSVTAHGVLLALVFTTFFIMGLGFLFVRVALDGLWSERWSWASFWVATTGTVITTLAILSGTSTVLYTFYPPLRAHPAFYIGATLLIVGSWLWCLVVLLSIGKWRRRHPGQRLPLAVHGIAATVIVWLLATTGLAAEVLGMLIPWSLGWVERIDPVLARTWFWWFGHPLTYFWLIPAYVVWYTVLPRHIGGRLFSDPLTRVVFVLFIVLSTPVGFHHQFTDPGVSSSWKLVHTFTTYAILFPSLVTAFSVIASIEIAGRLRGGSGVFGWLRRLPWSDPLYSAVALSMLAFALGGFGGAINAAYAMNTAVHNTAWIHGHFHLTVGTTVSLTFMGVAYWLAPRLLGRELALPRLAAVQPYLWFGGMMLFSISSHITGLMGQPRRVYSADYAHPAADAWRSLTLVSAVGGVILFLAAGSWILVLAVTAVAGRRIEPPLISFAQPLHPPPARADLWDRLGLWTAVAALLILIAYGYPILHLLSMERFGSLPHQPF